MQKQIVCGMIFTVVVVAAFVVRAEEPAQSGKIEEQREIKKIKEERFAAVQEYNAEKKALHQDLQNQLNQYDNGPQNRQIKSDIMNVTRTKEKQLQSAFQQKMRELSEREAKLLQRNLPPVRSVDALLEDKQIVDLQQRIAEQDSKRKKVLEMKILDASIPPSQPESWEPKPAEVKNPSQSLKASDKIKEGMDTSKSQVKKKLTDQLKESQDRIKTFKDRRYEY